jgi:thiazole synthase
MDLLHLGDHAFSSRLILGTGKFSGVSVMLDAVKASTMQILTRPTFETIL